jgi:hypothetical protein
MFVVELTDGNKTEADSVELVVCWDEGDEQFHGMIMVGSRYDLREDFSCAFSGFYSSADIVLACLLAEARRRGLPC